jgi:nitrite reductase/ring-hydroxylating ferredoxin subunit
MVERTEPRPVELSVLGRVAWALVLGAVGAAVLLMAIVLWPPDRTRSVVSGRAHAWDGRETSASLVYRDGRWVGSADDFPPGSTTQFRPPEHPSFYLVRYPDGTFRAMADRSAHRGRRVEWRDARPGSQYAARGPKGGFFDGDSTFFTDGFPESGPAPRPLDPFPLTIENGRLYVAPYANCPSYASGWRWCDRRAGSDEPPERCSDVYPDHCWSLTRCPRLSSHFCRLP